MLFCAMSGKFAGPPLPLPSLHFESANIALLLELDGKVPFSWCAGLAFLADIGAY